MANTLDGQFIKDREGFIAVAKYDAKGYSSYGYGFTRKLDGSKVKSGETITRATADAWFPQIASTYEKHVQSSLTVAVSDNVYTALVSFDYNTYQAPVLCKMLNDGKTLDEVATQMAKYVYADGVKVQGLVNRRAKEIELLKSGSTNSNSNILLPLALVVGGGYILNKLLK